MKELRKNYPNIESIYVIVMIVFFSIVYLTIITLMFTLLYDGYLAFFTNKQGTEFQLYSGIIGVILLVGMIWAFFPEKKNGLVLTKKDAPKIFQLVEKAVAKTKIHQINNIRLIPGSSIAVTGLFNKELLIGIASLRHITEKDFEAILYHEIGHFAAKDTKIGRILGIYFETIEKQYISSLNFLRYCPHLYIAFIGLPSLIITWLLLHLFSFLYAPYSKFKEYKADEFAVDNTNPKQFANALGNYCAYTHAHDTIMSQIIIELLKENKKLNNVYATMTSNWTNENAEAAMSAVLGAEERFRDSHPSLRNRLNNLHITKVEENKGDPLNSVIHNFEKFEERLSDDYTIRVGINMGLLDRKTKKLNPA